MALGSYTNMRGRIHIHTPGDDSSDSLRSGLEGRRPDKPLGSRPLVDRLGRDFFARYTPDVARDLLGCILVRRVGMKSLAGRIVEVEAYRGKDDPASHS